MKKFLKLLIGIVLLPLCWAVSRAVYLLLTMALRGGAMGWTLSAGFFVAVLGFFLLPQAFRTYVLGHEMTHALAGLLMGAKIGKMKVGRDGGHVELSKNNFMISLAPYFFPFYTGVVIGLWALLGVFLEMSPFEAWGLGLVGFTWGFHVMFTIYMLSQHQPDVQLNGRIFSYVVIYLANLFGVALWMVLVGEPTFKEAGALLSMQAMAVYGAVWALILSGRATLQQFFQILERSG